MLAWPAGGHTSPSLKGEREIFSFLFLASPDERHKKEGEWGGWVRIKGEKHANRIVRNDEFVLHGTEWTRCYSHYGIRDERLVRMN